MYRIGEFSKITNLSIRTLRFYNDIGLLVPEEVDIFTNYRYYGEENIKQVRLIEELKNVGFSLEEIKSNWNEFNDGLFLRKKEELLADIEAKYEAIKKIDELRSRINNGVILEEQKSSEIKIKSIF